MLAAQEWSQSPVLPWTQQAYETRLSAGSIAIPPDGQLAPTCRITIRFALRSEVVLCEPVVMGMMKNYFLNLLEQCSEEKFGQDAIEWGVVSGLVQLTYDLERDVRETMSRYDEIIEAYRRSYGPSKMRAPMERAVPSRLVKAEGATHSVKKEHVA
jgi:hypothetical protein